MKELLRRKMRTKLVRQGQDSALFQLANSDLLVKLEQFFTACRLNKKISPNPSIGLYWPMPGEVDTRPYWRRWIEAGWTLYLPTILPSHGMCFGQVEEELLSFYEGRGLLSERHEKIAQHIIQVSPRFCLNLPWHPDILHVPGLAFTLDGLRLGQGGGYYDRYLAACRPEEVITVSTAFSFQVQSSLPYESWDIKIERILMENSFGFVVE